MSYGLMTSGYNTYTVVTSEGKSLVYVGKATQQTGSGDTYYVQDQYTQHKRYELGDLQCCQQADGSDSPCSFSAYTGYGGFLLSQYGEDLVCGSHGWTITLADETVYLTYQINSCDSIPTVFIHSSDVDYAATVISIYQIPTTSNYTLRVLASFPSGQRSAAVAKFSLYCFHTTDTAASSGYGMELYDSNSDVAFNTNNHPAVVGDILSLTALGGTPSAPTETSSFLSTPPKAASTMSKPAFLSMDWARPVRTYVSSQVTVQDKNWLGFCDDDHHYKARYIQPFVGSGFNIQNDGNARVNVTGTTLSEWGMGSNSTSSGDTMAWNTMPLPISVPIIEGADYD